MSEDRVVPQSGGEEDSLRAKSTRPKQYKLGASRRSDLDSYLRNLARCRLAAMALLLAEIVTAIGCILIPCAGLYVLGSGLVAGDVATILYAAIVTPVAFMLEFAMLVVFARVAEM
ncbi:MAG: hypothetical protein HQ567_29475 [Candidatus Nealsonbacteria bacterium]|nr:hypothetical protein [Candidatus Nealsonbacteria bacterium]